MYRYCLISNFFKETFLWNVFWQKIKLLFKVKTIRFYILSHLSARFIILRLLVISDFCCEEFGETHFHSFNFFEISFTKEMGHGLKQMTDSRRKIRAVCGSSSIPPNSWLFVLVVGTVWGFALSCCKRTLFRLTMMGISVSKFHEPVPVVENKDPQRLHGHLKQTLSESHFQISIRHTTLIWGRADI